MSAAKAKDLGITWVVVLGFIVWSMHYQLPPPCYSFIFPSLSLLLLPPYLIPPPMFHSIIISLSLSLTSSSVSSLPYFPCLTPLPLSLPLPTSLSPLPLSHSFLSLSHFSLIHYQLPPPCLPQIVYFLTFHIFNFIISLYLSLLHLPTSRLPPSLPLHPIPPSTPNPSLYSQSLPLLPIPKYEYLIATDPGAGIGLIKLWHFSCIMIGYSKNLNQSEWKKINCKIKLQNLYRIGPGFSLWSNNGF